VIEAIENAYRDRLTVSLIMGGLRPGTVEPITPAERDEIFHHWHEVRRRTGQEFTFEGAMPEGFVYDTEPPSRAVVAVAALKPGATLAYFERVQAAFYMERQNVTQPNVLAHLAQGVGVEADRFSQAFHSPEVNAKTLEQFRQVYDWGVRGFPTVILQHAEELSVLTRGYRPFEELQPTLDAWLSRRDTQRG
jgi:putative protein-disulfide isomerase